MWGEKNNFKLTSVFLNFVAVKFSNYYFLGYHPADPKVVRDRMKTLEDAYEELVRLAAERRDRLEDSRKLWQFYWDMADEEGWIKEKEQLMSSPDLGRDLTSVHLLLNKQKVKFVKGKL